VESCHCALRVVAERNLILGNRGVEVVLVGKIVAEGVIAEWNRKGWSGNC
jgi:hypothetical protein